MLRRRQRYVQFNKVHMPVSVRKQTKMNKPKSPIGRLPIELLVLILDHVIHTYRCTVNHADSLWKLKQELASVSHHWRNVILNSPTLWTTIVVSKSQNSQLVEMCLKRSKEVLPLDIEVEGGYRDDRASLSAPLDAVMRFAHRWCSLHVTDARFHDKSPGDYVVKKINHLNFPLLRQVVIPEVGTFPRFLLPVYSPVLEHLQLGYHPAWPSFVPAPTLKTLHLKFGYPRSQSALDCIPTQALTTLSLSGQVDGWLLEPQSVHFPHLNKLILSVNAIHQFLVAVIVPNLEHFIYSPSEPPSVTFADLGSKFSNVYHLSLLGGRYQGIDCNEAVCLSKAFPSARHIEVGHQNSLRLVIPWRHYIYPYGNDYPNVDVWQQLETLTLQDLSSIQGKDFEYLSGWMEK